MEEMNQNQKAKEKIEMMTGSMETKAVKDTEASYTSQNRGKTMEKVGTHRDQPKDAEEETEEVTVGRPVSFIARTKNGTMGPIISTMTEKKHVAVRSFVRE